MKCFLTIAFLALSCHAFSQDLKDCGLDDDPNLTHIESEFLEQYMRKDQLNGTDLSNKKVLIITGNSGRIISTKSAYFDAVKQWHAEGDKIATWMVDLTDQQKQDLKAVGYDEIITYWVKYLSKRRIRLLIKELGKK